MIYKINEMEQPVVQFTLHFFTLNSSDFIIDVSDIKQSEISQDFISGILKILCTFPKNESDRLDQPIELKFNMLQQMTSQLRDQLIFIFEKNVKIQPQFHKAISIFKSIKDNEYFFVFPYLIEENLEFKMYLHYFLDAKNRFATEEEITTYVNTEIGNFKSLFKIELEKYSVQSYGDSSRRTYIGTKPNISNGACRFCKLTVREGAKFSKVAHTISEAFGNKKIVTADECDACNEKFGGNIEPHLIEYLNLLRVYFQIKGKKGVPKLKFKNGEVKLVKVIEDGKEVETFVIASKDIVENENGLIISLESFNQVNKQKIFKCLCKYALSVLEVEELLHFEKTIKWIQSEHDVGDAEIPLSIAKIFMHNYSAHPQFTIYKRKDDSETSLPHIVVEFKIGTLALIFILPFSAKDSIHFHIEKDFKKLHDVFTKYKITNDLFDFEDLSCSEDKDYIFKIKMHNRKTSIS
ncbi:hypothetical protein [Acinetobacter baumannii]|uniref:hypothetical protein n=1 Tax=Acinetobacter baumannii TaxID=470 RepID=UPI0007EAE755|nr:hypothetical protein [Acinetobacter baumannii]OBA11988.1 hypothetical protein A9988_09205 [Acinetobacter calcoaceticus]